MEKNFKVFVILAIVVLGASIAASTYFVLRQLDGKEQTVATEQTDIQPKLTEVSMGDAIMTNIAVEDDRVQHFAKIKLSIGVDTTDEKAYKAFNEVLTTQAAGVRNELISVIGEQTYTMLNSREGKIKLADEIVARLNKVLDTKIIYDVRYEEYFVQ